MKVDLSALSPADRGTLPEVISLRFFYSRLPREDNKGQIVYHPYSTHCYLCDPGEDYSSTYGIGEALCHPGDRFLKSQGRKLALQRAMENFTLPARKAIWAAYFARKKQL